MSNWVRTKCLLLPLLLAVSGCSGSKTPQQADTTDSSEVAPSTATVTNETAALPTETPQAEPSQTAWPSSLSPLGNGYPATGAPCRRLRETPAVSNWLDDSAILVGCPTKADAETLIKARGGKVPGTIDGITLVSVPMGDTMAPRAVPGDGDNQGDAKVAGTNYNAVTQVPCAGYRKHPAGSCRAGVVRNPDGTAFVTVEWPDNDSRTLYFDKAGKLFGADTAQADGSAQYDVVSKKVGDNTIVTIGPERYTIPDMLLQGD